MGDFRRQLARLRVAATTGRLPGDLGAWAVEELEELEPVAERVDERNRLLRMAADLVTGTTWSKARRLEAELERQAGGRLRTRSADLDGVGDLVARALDVDPGLQLSHRQLRRILG